MNARRTAALLVALGFAGCRAADGAADGHRGPVVALARGADGTRWSASEAGVEIARGGAVSFVALPFRPFALAASGAGAFVAGGVPGERGELAFVTADGAVAWRRALGGDVLYAVAAAGDEVVTGAADGGVLRLRARAAEPAAEIARHTAPCRAVAVSTRGCVASGGRDGLLLLRGAVARAVDDHTAGVECLLWTRDGTLASGALDGRVRLHDSAGALRRTYHGLGARVLALAESAHGLLAGLGDGRVVRLDPDSDAHETVERLGDPVFAMLAGDAIEAGGIGAVRRIAPAARGANPTIANPPAALW